MLIFQKNRKKLKVNQLRDLQNIVNDRYFYNYLDVNDSSIHSLFICSCFYYIHHTSSIYAWTYISFVSKDVHALSNLNYIHKSHINTNRECAKVRGYPNSINMASRYSHGVQRVLAKLEASINSENYYEAHQMYRTLYFRWASRRDCLAPSKCLFPRLILTVPV